MEMDAVSREESSSLRRVWRGPLRTTRSRSYGRDMLVREEEQLLPIDRLLRILWKLDAVRGYRISIFRDHKGDIEDFMIDIEGNSSDE